MSLALQTIYPVLQGPPPFYFGANANEASHLEAWVQEPQVPVIIPFLTANGWVDIDVSIWPPVVVVEDITLDKWFVQASEPVRELLWPVAVGLFIPDYARLLDAEYPFVDKWLAQYPDLHLVPHWPILEGLFEPDRARLLDSEFTFVTWRAIYPDLHNPLPWPVPVGDFQPDYARLLDAEFPSLDKWESRYPDIHLLPQWPVPEGLFLPDYARLLDSEFTFTTWRAIYPDFIFSEWRVDEGWRDLVSSIPTAETITLDKWFQPVNQPVRLQPSPEGIFVIDPVQLLVQPPVVRVIISNTVVVFVSTTLYPSRQAAPIQFAPDEIVTMDKWYQPVQQPYPAARWPVLEGAQLSDPARLLDPEFVFLSWLATYPDLHLVPQWPVIIGFQDPDVSIWPPQAAPSVLFPPDVGAVILDMLPSGIAVVKLIPPPGSARSDSTPPPGYSSRERYEE